MQTRVSELVFRASYSVRVSLPLQLVSTLKHCAVIMKSIIAFFVVSTFLLSLNLFNSAAAQNSGCAINQICFALDQSGSISDENYEQEQKFVVNITRAIKARSPNAFFSAYAFSGTSSLIQGSTQDVDGAFIPAINKDRVFSGSTDIASGLDSCFKEINGKQGNRVITLITDGQSTNPKDLVKQIKDAGIALLTVGIGSSVDEKLLKDIASAPNFFFASTFQTLPDDVVTVAEGACDVADPSPDVDVTPDPAVTSDADVTPDAWTFPTVTPISYTTPHAAPYAEGCTDAYAECDFKFEGETGLSKYDVMLSQDLSFTPRIIAKDPSVTLGVLNTNGIVPEFIEGPLVWPITALAAPPFTPTHFKPFPIPQTQGSGIGHETFHGDQHIVAKNQCVRVYFTSFQVLDPSTGYVMYNFDHVGTEMNKCVVFRT